MNRWTHPTLTRREAVFDVTSKYPKVPQSAIQAGGAVAVVDQGKSRIAGYVDGIEAPSVVPRIVFGDHTKVLKFVDHPFVSGADGTKVLHVGSGFDPKYVFHYLGTRALPNVGYSRHFKFLKELDIPQPSLDEQRRIAAILDQADALRAMRSYALRSHDSLIQAAFNEMFGDPNDATQVESFDSVATLVAGKSLLGSEDDTNPVRVLKISAVTSGTFRPAESKPLPTGYTVPTSHFVKDDDLLMSRANTAELVGAVTHVHGAPPFVAVPDKIWRFVWRDTRSVPEYYAALLRHPTLRRRMSALASGSGGSMKNISKVKLAQMPLPVAPFDLQQAFANHSRAIRHAVEVAEGESIALDELFASLQSRAFRGEL